MSWSMQVPQWQRQWTPESDRQQCTDTTFNMDGRCHYEALPGGEMCQYHERRHNEARGYELPVDGNCNAEVHQQSPYLHYTQLCKSQSAYTDGRCWQHSTDPDAVAKRDAAKAKRTKSRRPKTAKATASLPPVTLLELWKMPHGHFVQLVAVAEECERQP